MAERRDIKGIIEQLLTEWGSIANRHVVAAASVSRQAAHAHLRKMVDSGELIAEGAGRSVRYRRSHARQRFRYRCEGLEEHRVWSEVRRETKRLSELPDGAERLFHSAVVELVNNAIVHSASDNVEVAFHTTSGRLALEVTDRGVGIFDHLATELQFNSKLGALQELSKGKLTTRPQQHTGEGLFFISRVADYFEIESGGLRLMVDNEIDDISVASVPEKPGTRVRFEADMQTERTLEEAYQATTEAFEQSKRCLVVNLFAIGVRFISRSEAKRMLSGLERFREVVLDFKGVEAVGQGFVDEVFRVWASANPETRLRPINMVPAVRFLIERGRLRDAANP